MNWIASLLVSLCAATTLASQEPGRGPGRPPGQPPEHGDWRKTRAEEIVEQRSRELREQVHAIEDLMAEIRIRKIARLEADERERGEYNRSVCTLLDRLVEATKKAEDMATSLRDEDRAERAREELWRRQEREREGRGREDDRRRHSEAAERAERMNVALAKAAVGKALFLEFFESPQAGLWTIRQGKLQIRVANDPSWPMWDEGCQQIADTIKVRYRAGGKLEFPSHDGDNSRQVHENQKRFYGALMDAFAIDPKSQRLAELVKWGRENSFRVPGVAQGTPVLGPEDFKGVGGR